MLVDASPLIYLAKLDALDVFEASGHEPLVTAEAERETARPGLAYAHPDALVIAEALRAGVLRRTPLEPGEVAVAGRLLNEAGGLSVGEAQVLATAASRKQPALLFERQATRLGRSLGVDVWTPIELLFAGTPEPSRLADRIRGFARLVQMRFEDIQTLMQLIEERKR